MIDKVRPVTGIGINCSKPEYVESLIEDIRIAVTDKPIAVYPNLGESYDSKTKTWYGDPASFVDYVRYGVRLELKSLVDVVERHLRSSVILLRKFIINMVKYI